MALSRGGMVLRVCFRFLENTSDTARRTDRTTIDTAHIAPHVAVHLRLGNRVSLHCWTALNFSFYILHRYLFTFP